MGDTSVKLKQRLQAAQAELVKLRELLQAVRRRNNELESELGIRARQVIQTQQEAWRLANALQAALAKPAPEPPKPAPVPKVPTSRIQRIIELAD